MDFRLKVFKKVAERLSFTKASRDLFITQPAITKHINELEKHFGRSLFNRHGKKISLTTEGELLLSYAKRILELYDKLEDDFLTLNNKFPEKITIGASTTISQYILPSLLSRFKSVYPKTTITLLNDNSENIESLIINKQIDIGLTEGNTLNPLLHYETFIKDEIVLVTKSTNTKVKKDEITLQELTQIPLIYREEGSGTRDIIDNSLKEVELSSQALSIEMILGSSESIKTYLLNSNAFAFLSIHSITEELKNNKFKVIDIRNLDIKRTFQFANLHGEYSSITKKVKQFFISSFYNM
ncbi:LysR family transcriptional regulator [Fulvivirgaceae bacterium BMA10]|uniref:LysR family transcriptional regulator n=1 Tax=Splendidivirga corallicola TaxID=3051826 RepID=A0ABT8KSG0_9BACT|nr:LysR family transcriptional regulator [Fulvivirgaceae bacterium BMA10]